ncbi:hypothetical protein QTP86_027092, partial [Hemibagrus guttatus]
APRASCRLPETEIPPESPTSGPRGYDETGGWTQDWFLFRIPFTSTSMGNCLIHQQQR